MPIKNRQQGRHSSLATAVVVVRCLLFTFLLEPNRFTQTENNVPAHVVIGREKASRAPFLTDVIPRLDVGVSPTYPGFGVLRVRMCRNESDFWTSFCGKCRRRMKKCNDGKIHCVTLATIRPLVTCERDIIAKDAHWSGRRGLCQRHFYANWSVAYPEWKTYPPTTRSFLPLTRMT
jgi:hypothetical protein